MMSSNERTPALGASGSDTGAEVQRRFRYQHQYTAMLAIQMYMHRNDFKEIYCELHEDILGVLQDNRFVAIQIKTRDLSQGPFGLADEQIKHSIIKFIKLCASAPENYSKFVIVSNCGFIKGSNAKSIENLVAQVKATSTGQFFVQKADQYIQMLVKESQCDRTIVIKVLSLLECVNGPGLDDIERTIIVDHLHEIESCKHFDPTKLRLILDQIVLAVYYKSSKKIDNSIAYYAAFIAGGELERIHQEINAKRITNDTILNVVENISNSVYIIPHEKISVKVSQSGSEKMRLKMNLGGIDSFQIDNIETLIYAASNFILEESYKRGSDLTEFEQQINQVSVIILNEASEARSRAISDGSPFGSRMLHDIEDRLRKLAINRKKDVFGVPYEILKGLVGILTGDCKIAYSSIPAGGFA